MKLLKLDDLRVKEDRQRQEVDDDYIKELAESIASPSGLLHAPVLEGDCRTLLAGECRTKAMRLLHEEGRSFQYGGETVPKDCIPYTTTGDLTEDELYEAELDENIKRRDLSWQDRARAITKLHDFRSAQAAARGEKQTLADTVQELLHESIGGDTAKRLVQENRLLSEGLSDPDVARAKTKKEGLKILKKKKEAAHRQRLAEEFKSREIKTFFNVLRGDTRDHLKSLPPATFDVIICDPPYGVDADQFGEQADAAHQYKDDWDYARSLYEEVATRGFEVTRDQAHLYAFCDISYFAELRQIFEACGWTVWYRPLIWYKGSNSGMLPAPEYGPRNTYEACLFAYKGKAKVLAVAPDVVDVPAVSKPIFGAQKPIALYQALLARVALPGSKVLDCFAGAGPTVGACRALDLECTVIEMNEEKCDYIEATFGGDDV